LAHNQAFEETVALNPKDSSAMTRQACHNDHGEHASLTVDFTQQSVTVNTSKQNKRHYP
jgi:hypothetical protein